MNIFGYDQEDEEYNKLLTMKEICLDLNLDEIDEVIEFLKYVRERHGALSDIAHMPHTHYSEWKHEFGKIKPEIVVSTTFEQNPPIYIDLRKEIQ